MCIILHWPTAAAACFIRSSVGRSPSRSFLVPMPMAPEDTKITSCPAFFRSDSTLTSSSTWRMFNRPVAWAKVEVPTLTTMRIGITSYYFFWSGERSWPEGVDPCWVIFMVFS